MNYEDIIPDLYILPDIDNHTVSVSCTRPKRATTAIQWTIADGSKTVASGKIPAASKRIAFVSKLKNYELWSPESPYLYSLILEWKAGSERFNVSQNFGMRKINVKDGRICLNNEPFYIRGFIRGREAHDHPNLLGLTPVEYYEKNIRAAKAFGFNFVRFHSKVPPRAFFDAADRLGLLAHIEVRKYFGKYQAERDMLDHEPNLVNPELWKKTILEVRNYASLMAYCLGNEINSPGVQPEVVARKKQLDSLDKSRLFIDTCARGEYDRANVDYDVQHMGYFAPFGCHSDMFNITDNWAIFGSIDPEKKMSVGEPGARISRAIPQNRPTVAHEVGHYIALRDIDELKRKFKASGATEPWWLNELLRLRDTKGMAREYPQMLKAADRFQFIWHKQVFEAIRRSPILNGFNFLQLSDTDLYENTNGLIDCFDDFKKTISPDEYRRFNSDVVIAADLPKRSYFESDRIQSQIYLSNWSSTLGNAASLEWSLVSKDSSRRNATPRVSMGGRIDSLDIRRGLMKLAKLDIKFPQTETPLSLELKLVLTQPGKNGKDNNIAENSWPLWLFPNRPEMLAAKTARIELDGIDLSRRYPNLKNDKKSKLMIANRFSDALFKHLEKGGDALLLWRVPETRALGKWHGVPTAPADVSPEPYYLPSTWDRFKPVIWDRGHCLGGYINEHPALARFPNDGLIDFNFQSLIEDCDKFNLDDFPTGSDAIIKGVDKAARDRYDVFKFKLSELEPSWTQRHFAYLFDIKVGKGRLLLSAFNFTGIETHAPEVCGMFESLVACAASKDWKPAQSISVAELKRYLKTKSAEPRVLESGMSQYWQLDDAPLESKSFWTKAFAWKERNVPTPGSRPWER